MKKLLLLVAMSGLVLGLVACNDDSPAENAATTGPVETTAPESGNHDANIRAVYHLEKVVLDETEEIYHGHGTPFDHATLTFVGEEQGGNVIIQIGQTNIIASINPSREHPSFESGYWHHHLYAGPTASGSPRISFLEWLPEIGIDENPEATDNTQSAYQHGNLHHVVETGAFRLRFMIDGVTTDLIFENADGHHGHDHEHAHTHDEEHTEDEHGYDEHTRAVYHLDRVVLDEGQTIEHGHGTPFDHARLTFVGEEQGGNVVIQIGDTNIIASINPSREHPSFESGYWHHHLYAGPTASGSPRISFLEWLPEIGIDENPEATDNTQSAYQHGNLHYVVETGEFRLRFTIDGVITDLMFDTHTHGH